MSAPVIRHIGGDERLFRTSIPVASSVEIKPGWFVNLDTALCVATDAATEDSVFAGIALTGHKPNVDDRDSISVSEQCEVEVDVVSASYVRGAGLKVNGTAGGDSIVLEDDAGANTIAWAAETKATTTRLRVLINVWLLRKLYGEVNV